MTKKYEYIIGERWLIAAGFFFMLAIVIMPLNLLELFGSFMVISILLFMCWLQTLRSHIEEENRRKLEENKKKIEELLN